MIEAILPADVSAADTFHELPDEQLFPQEEAAVVKAVDKRQREFRTVRGCARIALAQLGLPRPVLVPGASGAVSWPGGIVGSMTHCAGYRAAAVARVVNVLGLGVDAEPHAALPVGVLDSVALPGEQAHLAELRRTAGGVCWDRLLFSGKESVYKAWFPLTGRWLGFEDALVTIDPVRGTFTAHLQVAGPDVEGRELTDFHGRWLVRDGLVLTAVIVRHTDVWARSGAKTASGCINPHGRPVNTSDRHITEGSSVNTHDGSARHIWNGTTCAHDSDDGKSSDLGTVDSRQTRTAEFGG